MLRQLARVHRSILGRRSQRAALTKEVGPKGSLETALVNKESMELTEEEERKLEQFALETLAETHAIAVEAAEVRNSPEFQAFDQEVDQAIEEIEQRYYHDPDQPLTAEVIAKCQHEVRQALERIRLKHYERIAKSPTKPSWYRERADFKEFYRLPMPSADGANESDSRAESQPTKRSPSSARDDSH